MYQLIYNDNRSKIKITITKYYTLKVLEKSKIQLNNLKIKKNQDQGLK